MDYSGVIERFYTAFAEGDTDSMVSLYHPDIVFRDPAFGELKGERVMNMWRMLNSRSKGQLRIRHENVRVSGSIGTAIWHAEYEYGPAKRPVSNHISARFEFQDGLIIKHTDDFDLWKWSSQALGLSGRLLGWSGFMKRKIQEKTNHLLDRYSMEQVKQ
jgi:ketosteroid isomerase-like protein